MKIDISNRILFPVMFLIVLITACASRDDGDDVVGPDGGNVVDGAHGGDLFPPGYQGMVCYPSRESGTWWWNCNPEKLHQAATAEYVGVARSLGLSGYWAGVHYSVGQSDGRYRAEFDNTAVGTVNEMTYGTCSNPDDANCWAQYTLDSGGYTLCGNRGSRFGCGQFFEIVGPDELPKAVATYPATPPN